LLKTTLMLSRLSERQRRWIPRQMWRESGFTTEPATGRLEERGVYNEKGRGEIGMSRGKGGTTRGGQGKRQLRLVRSDNGGRGGVLGLELHLVDLGGHVGDLSVARASDGVPSDERKRTQGRRTMRISMNWHGTVRTSRAALM
jgi:hypothetical protein